MYSVTQLSALSRLFSAAIFREMAKKGHSGLFRALIKEAQLDNFGPEVTVGQVFDAAFDILKVDGRRDEYVYRAAVNQKILMGKHSLRTASMLNEFRVGRSKADLVILNGTSTVYEIKSERDSLVRLPAQIEDYMKVFARVNVITSKSHINAVIDMVPDGVGVMCLSNRYQIQTIREAGDFASRICPLTVFESLRSAERVEILKAFGIVVPDAPNTLRHSILKNLFLDLDPELIHSEMVRVLKVSRSLQSVSAFLEILPKSLITNGLSVVMSKSDQPKIIKALSTPLNEAMKWS